jgi:hypothetical protein
MFDIFIPRYRYEEFTFHGCFVPYRVVDLQLAIYIAKIDPAILKLDADGPITPVIF